MPVPPDGCDDSDIFDCGARHHAERFSIGDITTTMLLLPNVACGTHASASRWLRRRCLQTAARTAASSSFLLRNSASCRAVFDRGSKLLVQIVNDRMYTLKKAVHQNLVKPTKLLLPLGNVARGAHAGASRLLARAAFECGHHGLLLLGNVARGTHAGASRRLRRQRRLQLWGSASRRAA